MTVRCALAGAAVVVVGSLVACSGTTQPAMPDSGAGSSITTSSLVGRPLAEVYGLIGYTPPAAPPPSLGVVTYDLSPAVTGGTASATPGDPGTAWTVLAACYTLTGGPKLALGVVPSAGVTADVDSDARAQRFNDLLVECADPVDSFNV